MSIRVQTAPFDPGHELNAIHAGNMNVGAVVTFVGYVRDINQEQSIQKLFLEHYPGMTEKALNKIREEAMQRWPLIDAHILHRVGPLSLAEPIVFVATSSMHRDAAFTACEFIMDYLKTRAPFWKKEQTDSGSHWVEGRDSDTLAASRWNSHNKENQ
ncbi:molybdopterin synthase catalytic subunit MoaE [Denitrificimonas sp. JX-1]|uniref:Molybdopterin synthase catalytic subunit n=1 Tax=Denitrificimonas halotolerans TaxID=3098930 RepID=A0ABU5GPE9_9GAMM|nr:molybdopterin synthase catalytic subunit MoaE [Denitrificimonas sp. JX-1]MDY7218874.1 molybdopterin synthase catalytic subunit MoaE [Denitrificimonas sp. JX-1]